MNLRLSIVDEYQFLICVKHSLWGSRRARLGKWKIGDYLILIVDKALAGLAEVSGKHFESNERVWSNGLFPHRVAIKWLHIPAKEKRPKIEGNVRDAMVSALGERYTWGIVRQKVITGADTERIINAIRSTPNSLRQVLPIIDKLLQETKNIQES